MFYDCLVLGLVNNWYKVVSIFFDSESSAAMYAADASRLVTRLLSCTMAVSNSDMMISLCASVDILYVCAMSEREDGHD